MMLRSILLAATLLTPALTPDAVRAQGAAGPYLSARIAGFDNDYAAAAENFGRLLRQDALPPEVLENAIVVYGALGEFEKAAQVARRLDQADLPSRFGDSVRMVEALIGADLPAAAALLEGERGVGGALLDGLLRGWVAFAGGEAGRALDAFDALAENDGFAPIAHLHKAYALALSGDYEGADEILSGRSHGPLNLSSRGVEAHAQVLLQLDRTADAQDLLAQANGVVDSPALQDLAARVEAGAPVAFDVLRTPQDGMAESYFTLAALLAGENAVTFTLINAQAAIALRGDHVDALVLTGELLSEQDQHDLAAAVLARVPADDPSFFGAEIARAEVLLASDREDAAVEALQSLTRGFPDEQSVHMALGDTLRRLERFEGSAAAYDRALELNGEDEPRDWFLYYARGIALERSDRFPLAEADFRRALELNPDHPLVLNYLGYSLVEERKNLDEALDMIERAVAARPDDGYITDSLGWVFYRLGRFEDAVAPMERAVELEPLDPLINDHLGDVLWMVGRKREAEFQWKRALSLDPEPAEKARIERKLNEGLDAVLDDEGGVGAIESAQD